MSVPDPRDDRASLPTAVVVGATGGVGRSVVELLRVTHRIWLVGRRSSAGPNRGRGPRAAQYWSLDFEGDLAELAPPSDLGPVDLLVLAAGKWSSGTIAEGTPKEWADVLAVNVIGQIALTQLLLPHLRRAHGRVIALSSTAVDGSPRGRAAYVASKAALDAFLVGLHEEERRHGIQVTTLHAGRIATPMHREVTDAEATGQKVEAMAPDDLARVIVMLAELPSSVHLSELTLRAASFVEEPPA
ncbi:SDR family oxidoreductase [Luteimicrobium sp. DT211]|uniref:SDR family oxidoreductase n=1 Tax=Luteimicrobium sp. DT211 TaxID=3393412 RepID=UPI003CF5EE43